MPKPWAARPLPWWKGQNYHINLQIIIVQPWLEIITKFAIPEVLMAWNIWLLTKFKMAAGRQQTKDSYQLTSITKLHTYHHLWFWNTHSSEKRISWKNFNMSWQEVTYIAGHRSTHMRTNTYILSCCLIIICSLHTCPQHHIQHSNHFIIRPPGTTVPDGLMFYRRCIFFFLGRPEQPFRTGLCSAADVFF